MGKRSDLPRNARDFYATPLKAALPLLPFINLDPPMNFIEPCAGDGRLIRHIEDNSSARCVYASDIQPLPTVKGLRTETYINAHGFDTDWPEIVSMSPSNPSAFVTNPPFLNNKDSGFQLLRLIDTLSKVLPTILLLPADFAFNVRSAEVMTYATDVIPVGRVKWVEDSKFSSTENFAWFQFDQLQTRRTGPILHPRRK